MRYIQPRELLFAYIPFSNHKYRTYTKHIHQHLMNIYQKIGNIFNNQVITHSLLVSKHIAPKKKYFAFSIIEHRCSITNRFNYARGSAAEVAVKATSTIFIHTNKPSKTTEEILLKIQSKQFTFSRYGDLDFSSIKHINPLKNKKLEKKMKQKKNHC